MAPQLPPIPLHPACLGCPQVALASISEHLSRWKQFHTARAEQIKPRVSAICFSDVGSVGWQPTYPSKMSAVLTAQTWPIYYTSRTSSHRPPVSIFDRWRYWGNIRKCHLQFLEDAFIYLGLVMLAGYRTYSRELGVVWVRVNEGPMIYSDLCNGVRVAVRSCTHYLENVAYLSPRSWVQQLDHPKSFSNHLRGTTSLDSQPAKYVYCQGLLFIRWPDLIVSGATKCDCNPNGFNHKFIIRFHGH